MITTGIRLGTVEDTREFGRRLAAILRAGDLAESSKGQVSMTATDVLLYLGEALSQLTGRTKDEES